MRYILSLMMVSGLAVVIACQTSAKSSVRIDQPKQPLKPIKEEVAKSENHDDEAKRITLVDAKKAFDSGEVLFIDTRNENAYVNEHIKGAVNIPVSQIENKYEKIAKAKKVIAYCS